MITSKQILKATSLKNPKTLTRWANAGIIPKPHIGTHPKGRGKIAYWPDSVLERCQQIVKLRRQGHSLSSAVTTIENDRMLRIMERVESSPDLGAMLSEKKIKLAQEGDIDLASLLCLLIAKGAENVVSDTTMLKKLLAGIRSAGVAAQGVRYLQAGFNPICMFDGQKAEVMPDFRVAHVLSEEKLPSTSWVIIPLFAPLQKVFSSLGLNMPSTPTVRPAPKVRARQGAAIVEYDILLVGSDFEVIRESAKTIGMSQSNRE